MIRFAAILIAVGFLFSPASARTWHIEPGGSGDAPTIQAGIDSAAVGDTVELANGTFAGEGNRGIDFLGKAVTVRSVDGDPAPCVIDCGGADRGFYFRSAEGAGSILEGVTVMHGFADEGGGIYCGPASPHIIACVLVHNTASDRGGGLACVGAASPTLSQCTIAGNVAPAGAGIYCLWYSDARIEKSIVAANEPGEGVGSYGSEPSLDCTDLYGNEGGDWVGYIANQQGSNGNFSADPLFCDMENGDFTLDAASPCLNATGCGQIGALGQSCDVYTSVAETGSMPGRTLGLSVSPNPSTGEVSLRYSLPSNSPVPLTIYDIRGRVVRALEGRDASGVITWDRRTNAGTLVAPGVYFAKMNDGKRAVTERVVLIR